MKSPRFGASNQPHSAAEGAEGGAFEQGILKKELNLFDAVMIVVGTIIGSGIFLIPNSIAAELHSLPAVLLVWVLGGILTIFGALSLAELGSIYPGTGGLCSYLRHAYGPLTAFLYAWGLLFMIQSGSIAALAVGFGLYMGQVLKLSLVGEKLVSVACILGLTFINCLGIRGGKMAQNCIAVAKAGGLVVIIVLAWVKGSRPIRILRAVLPASGHALPLARFGIALVAVLWAYEGWHVVSFVAGEMKRPTVDLPRALFVGSAVVMLVYLSANIAYYHVLSPAAIQASSAVASATVKALFGSVAAVSVSVLILVSILGATNGMILSGPRVYYAMAREGIFPRPFGRIHERYRTPTVALIVQGTWASLLAVSGSYQQLFTDVIFTAWIFYGLAVAAVLVLRRTRPNLERPFHVPGYPWLPLLFCAAAIGVVSSTITERPGGALLGIGLIAVGIPVYGLYGRARQMEGPGDSVAR